MNSKLFIAAHRMTRRTIQPGDTYSVTFGQCLKEIRAGYREETPQDVADRIEAEILAKGGRAKQRVYGSEIRVYAKRVLANGCTQELGHFAIERRNGAARECPRNRFESIRERLAA